MAWVLRFARLCRKQRSYLKEYGLTKAESKDAENLLVRQALLKSFPDEMRSVKTGRDVASSSDIRGLIPNLERAYGRIVAALCMPHSAGRPVILSLRNSLTELIVPHFHARMKHQNVDATIVEIRVELF